eukprot:6492189-Amphidinium_carterae.2
MSSLSRDLKGHTSANKTPNKTNVTRANLLLKFPGHFLSRANLKVSHIPNSIGWKSHISCLHNVVGSYELRQLEFSNETALVGGFHDTEKYINLIFGGFCCQARSRVLPLCFSNSRIPMGRKPQSVVSSQKSDKTLNKRASSAASQPPPGKKQKGGNKATSAQHQPSQIGDCVCSLCEKRSQFKKSECLQTSEAITQVALLGLHFLPKAGHTWGLYSEDDTTKLKVPAGDTCLECFDIWQGWYPSILTWGEFVAKHKSDVGVQHVVGKARDLLKKGSCDPTKRSSTSTKIQIGIEVSREYFVAGMAELKKKCGLERVPARSLKFIPQVGVPNPESGEEENLYVFANPEEQESLLRKCKVRVATLTEHEVEGLKPSAFISPEHAESFLHEAVKVQGKDSGVANLLSKENYLLSFDDWFSKKFEKDEGENAPSLEQKVHGADNTLVGPAALVFNKAAANVRTPKKLLPMVKDPGHGTPPSIQRLASNVTMASDSASQIADVHPDQASMTEYSVAISTGERGIDSIEHFRQEIKLEWCADNTQDYRSVSGLRAACKRIPVNSERAAERLLMVEFLRQIDLVSKLHPEDFAELTTEALQPILQCLVENSVQLSSITQQQLMDKKLEELLQQRQFVPAISMIFPFAEEQFDPFNPRMAALDVEPDNRIKQFQETLFDKTVVPMLLEAKSKRTILLEVVTHALSLIEAVDYVKLESPVAAVAHDETTSILRGLHTLLVCESSVEGLFEVRGANHDHKKITQAMSVGNCTNNGFE